MPIPFSVAVFGEPICVADSLWTSPPGSTPGLFDAAGGLQALSVKAPTAIAARRITGARSHKDCQEHAPSIRRVSHSRLPVWLRGPSHWSGSRYANDARRADTTQHRRHGW